MATTSSGLTLVLGSLPNSCLHELTDARHAGHAADEDDLVDLGRLDAGLADRVEAWLAGALNEVEHELLEVGAGDRLDEVLRTGPHPR